MLSPNAAKLAEYLFLHWLGHSPNYPLTKSMMGHPLHQCQHTTGVFVQSGFPENAHFFV